MICVRDPAAEDSAVFTVIFLIVYWGSWLQLITALWNDFICFKLNSDMNSWLFNNVAIQKKCQKQNYFSEYSTYCHKLTGYDRKLWKAPGIWEPWY